MDDTFYLLWSTAGGWFTKSATYSTDLNEAQRLRRPDAMAFAKHRNYDGNLRYIPVLLSDVEELTK